MSLAKNRLKSHGLTGHGSKTTIDLREHTHQKMQPIKSLFACIRAKTCKIALLLTLTFPVALHAQQSIECQIMRQQILQRVNAPNQCQLEYQQCMANATFSWNPVFERAQCSIRGGGCQMGGALFGGEEQLQQAIQQYKNMCER